MTKPRTHLKFREPEYRGPTALCSTIDNTLLDLPIGHRIDLNMIGKGTDFIKAGLYEVYAGPFDRLFVERMDNGNEPIYERSYSLKYVGSKSK